MKRKALILIILILLSGSKLHAETLGDVQKEMDKIQEEYDKKMSELDESQGNYDELLTKITDTNKEIEKTDNEIIDTNNEMAKMESNIKALKEVQIPDVEAKALTTLEFIQDNYNKSSTVQLLNHLYTSDHPVEVAYGANKIMQELYNNLVELKSLLDELKAEEQELELKKNNLLLKQSELDDNKEYLNSLKEELSATIASLESEADEQKEEMEAQKEQERIFEEAGCGPDDVYGVDCAQEIIPEATTGDFIRPLQHGVVTNEFAGWSAFAGVSHAGIDLANSVGTPVYPTAQGQVLYSGWTEDNGGNSVIMLHLIDGVNYVTRYAHLNEIYVSTGDIVNSGEAIGALGSTGVSTGPHLHFEIEQQSTYIWSKVENPRNYVDFPILWEWW